MPTSSGTPILTAAETRAAEQALFDAGLSVGELMERAGTAVAEAAWRYGGGASALVLCGPGNNGGDGYVAARLLRERGMAVRVAEGGQPRSAAARNAQAAWGGAIEPLGDAAAAPLLIDALFGTGLTRRLDEQFAGPLRRLSAAARFTVAVDLPSGIGADDGADLGGSACDLTVALGGLKPGHRLQPGAGRCGTVRVADVGLIAPVVKLHTVERPRLSAPGPADHKYTRGYVAVVGGEMAGAALLAARGAQAAGAGYVTLAGGRSGAASHALVQRRFAPEILADERVGAVVVGSGLGQGNTAWRRLDAALASGRRLVIDADALGLLDGRWPPDSVLTPHEGEFARVFGRLDGSKLERARAAAKLAGAVVVLKGPDSVVAAPNGRAAIGEGPAWLASAGTGDVLAGVIGAMLARGLAPFEAATAALWLHGEAGRLAGAGLIADDLLRTLPRALVRATR